MLSSTSSDADIRLFGDTAIFTHRVTTIQVWDGEESTLHERESIVFQRQGDGAVARDPRTPCVRRNLLGFAGSDLAQLDGDSGER